MISDLVKQEEDDDEEFEDGTLQIYFTGDTSALEKLVGNKYADADGVILCVEFNKQAFLFNDLEERKTD